MIIETFVGSVFATNGYLVADQLQRVSVLIDAPQATADQIFEKANSWNTKIIYVINTHGHWDHIFDNAAIVRLTGAQLAIHRESEPLLSIDQTQYFGPDEEMELSKADLLLEEGQPLHVGGLKFDVLNCPGHCPGSVALVEHAQRWVFVGDVLFAGSIGRTDLPGGDFELLMDSIQTKLMGLPDDYQVFPGHGPTTTIGRERISNPFLNR